MAKILLCDDEGIQRAALRISLQRLPGLPLSIEEIREAVHGRQAVEMLSDWQPDIIFLDLRMPVMGGLEAAREIRSLLPDTEIIILTAYDEFNFAQEAIQVGVCDYLLKPATQADLSRVLQKAMAAILAKQAEQRQLAMLRQRVEAARPLIQQEYVADLLSGSNLTLDSLEERRSYLGLPAHPQTVLVLQLSDFAQATRGRKEADRQLLKEKYLLLVEQATAGLQALLHRLGSDRMAVLLPALSALPADDERQTAIALAERIRQTVNQQLQLQVTIGIGRVVQTPLDLRRSYSDALQALCHQAALGSNHVIHIDDVEQGTANHALPLEEEQLLQMMRLGNRAQTMALLDSLLALLERQEAGRLQSLRWRLLELLVLLTRAAILGGADSEQATLANVRHLEAVNQAAAPLELCQAVLQAADELLHLVSAERVLRHQRLIKRAISYLEQHYHEQISLDDVAKIVFLSPFYFSHVFKEQTGMTFVQYLTELRLQKAKQLLREQGLTIGQIAEQVGYNDVSYFSRVFKKLVSLTPTEYRNHLGG